MAAIARARTVALSALDGDVLAYLGEGRDGESLRMHRPNGRITVIGATYGDVDIAQAVYGSSTVDYRVMRSTLPGSVDLGPLACFYVPFFMDMVGDVATTIHQAQSLLSQNGLLAIAAHESAENLTAARVAGILSSDPCFTDVAVLIIDGEGLVTARRSGLIDMVAARADAQRETIGRSAGCQIEVPERIAS